MAETHTKPYFLDIQVWVYVICRSYWFWSNDWCLTSNQSCSSAAFTMRTNLLTIKHVGSNVQSD